MQGWLARHGKVNGMVGQPIGAALLLAVVAVPLIGQRAASPLIRGVLIAREGRPSGEFSVRAADNQVFRYRFDPKTYVEREDRLTDIPRLAVGEKLEVLSDEGFASDVRYARTVHVMIPPPPSRPVSQARFRAGGDAPDHFVPISTMSLAGVVTDLGAEWVVLHTRKAGNQTIRLRRDTRFLDNGERVEAADLHPNMRVFIRAGRNLYNEIEAYQIIWGEILEPR
ncbi:MAG: hypothetical protein JO336_05045 [Acidobacteriia bacterium]|nr:hypothetical protein [Terriglobia bacterium]